MHLNHSKLEFCHNIRSFCKPHTDPITEYRGDDGFACPNIYSAPLVLFLVPAVGLEYNQKPVSAGLSRLANKQARGLILGNQASKGGACLLACLFIAYI